MKVWTRVVKCARVQGTGRGHSHLQSQQLRNWVMLYCEPARNEVSLTLPRRISSPMGEQQGLVRSVEAGPSPSPLHQGMVLCHQSLSASIEALLSVCKHQSEENNSKSCSREPETSDGFHPVLYNSQTLTSLPEVIIEMNCPTLGRN
ncbi:hypothetical protein STEG23_018607 [Scotinomys teguina]